MKFLTGLVAAIGLLASGIAFAYDCYIANYNDCAPSGSSCTLSCKICGPFFGSVTDGGTHSYVELWNQGITGYDDLEPCQYGCTGNCPTCRTFCSSSKPGGINQWTNGQCCP